MLKFNQINYSAYSCFCEFCTHLLWIIKISYELRVKEISVKSEFCDEYIFIVAVVIMCMQGKKVQNAVHLYSSDCFGSYHTRLNWQMVYKSHNTWCKIVRFELRKVWKFQKSNLLTSIKSKKLVEFFVKELWTRSFGIFLMWNRRSDPLDQWTH